MARSAMPGDGGDAGDEVLDALAQERFSAGEPDFFECRG